MKKLLILLILQSCSYKNNIKEDASLFVQDAQGRKHYFENVLINKDNYCFVHQKYEYVEIVPKTQQSIPSYQEIIKMR
tara:strand:- start:245 stop:478 length:234 start_codon:yes stop_codon:yes gene_type:complete